MLCLKFVAGFQPQGTFDVSLSLNFHCFPRKFEYAEKEQNQFQFDFYLNKINKLEIYFFRIN